MLRDIAKQITTNDKLPTTNDEWLRLKGIGPYTAAAVCAFALRQRTLPIDTNIRRALGRLLFGVTYPQPALDDKIRSAIDRVLPKRGRFYDVPQAIFDLATTYCTKVPSCGDCPMRSVCPAAPKFLSGNVRVPKQMVKKSVESKHRDKKFPDRIYRGRILKLVRESNSVAIESVGPAVDPHYDKRLDRAWIAAMASRLVADGLLSLKNQTLSLP